MISDPSRSLNSYRLDMLDIGLCVITGLTCIPYAKLHWALSNENGRYSVWHKALAVLECIPVVGALVAVIERVSVLAISFFNTQQRSEVSPHNKDQPIIKERMSNATALEFISCINPMLFTELTQLAEKEAEEFLNRGGSLNIITQEKISKQRINIYKEEQVITGCNSGVNRSQVAAAVVTKMGITVKGVLAGGDSAMNPEADFHSFADPSEMGEKQYHSATNFTQTFGIRKLGQIGVKILASYIESEQGIGRAKKFYQDYIDELHSPTHFITFGPSGPSVIRRLLKREGSLRGFTITHSPWGDEIAHPPKDSGLEKYSTGSYERFATMLNDCFSIV